MSLFRRSTGTAGNYYDDSETTFTVTARTPTIPLALKPTPQAVAVAEMPKPVPPSLESELDQIEEAEYLRLSKELGVIAGQADLGWRPLDRLLAERGMGYYPFDQVMAFLSTEADKTTSTGGMKRRPSWEPLRQKDTWQEPTALMQQFSTMTHPLYRKKVPIQVLQLVADIEKVAPEVFNFYVSDYQAVRPDPFLGVRHMHNEMRVIYHWDEPAFKVNAEIPKL